MFDPESVAMSDLHRAAYIQAAGHALRGVTMTEDGTRCIFHFGPEAAQANSDYLDNAAIPVRSYVVALQGLKARVARELRARR